MEQRKRGRARVAVEIKLVREGALAVRGSLLDISAQGCRIRDLPEQVLKQFAIGDEVDISGVLTSGSFTLHGRVQRSDTAVGEIGVEVDSEGVAAVQALLGSPLAGVD